jgi:hypothetical protein
MDDSHPPQTRTGRRLKPPSPAMAVALLALFVALGGTGYAVTRINGKVLKNRSVADKKIKKNTLGAAEIDEADVENVGSARRAGSADSAATAGQASAANFATDALNAVNAQSAINAQSAATATSADDAKLFGGIGPLDLNRSSAPSNDSCDPDDMDIFPTCSVTASFTQPASSRVLLVASGTWWAPAAADGKCSIHSGSSIATGMVQEVGLGQASNVHNTAARGSGFSLTETVSASAGAKDFSLFCTETTGDMRYEDLRMVAVRLAD